MVKILKFGSGAFTALKTHNISTMKWKTSASVRVCVCGLTTNLMIQTDVFIAPADITRQVWAGECELFVCVYHAQWVVTRTSFNLAVLCLWCLLTTPQLLFDTYFMLSYGRHDFFQEMYRMLQGCNDWTQDCDSHSGGPIVTKSEFHKDLKAMGLPNGRQWSATFMANAIGINPTEACCTHSHLFL